MAEALRMFEPAEQERAAALRATGLFGSEPLPEFDELVALARDICDVPLSAISLLDEEQQFLLAQTGAVPRWLPRQDSICDTTLRYGSTLTVEDMQRDARFVQHPLVTGEMQVRFYSGVPVRTETGHAVGTLCVLDTRPRALTATQQRALGVLARQVETRMHLRTRVLKVEQQAAEIAAERELLHHFLDNLPMEAGLRDADGKMLFYNRAVSEHFKVNRTEWLGTTDVDLWGEERGAMLRAEDVYALRTGQRQESYAELPNEEGGTEYWKIIRSPFRMPSGEQLLASIGVNLTPELQREADLVKLQDQLEEANRKLRSLSLTDELTGLWNRRAFDARLETDVFTAEHSKRPLTLLMMDVDNFKSLNDTHGHPHGDEVLKEVGAVLQHAVRNEDIAARYGGEEFAVIMPGTDVTGAEALCKRISQAMDRVHWKHRPVTMSIGIAALRRGLSSDSLLDMADKAMYRAKRNGKNCAVAYEEEAAA